MEKKKDDMVILGLGALGALLLLPKLTHKVPTTPTITPTTPTITPTPTITISPPTIPPAEKHYRVYIRNTTNIHVEVTVVEYQAQHSVFIPAFSTGVIECYENAVITLPAGFAFSELNTNVVTVTKNMELTVVYSTAEAKAIAIEDRVSCTLINETDTKLSIFVYEGTTPETIYIDAYSSKVVIARNGTQIKIPDGFLFKETDSQYATVVAGAVYRISYVSTPPVIIPPTPPTTTEYGTFKVLITNNATLDFVIVYVGDPYKNVNIPYTIYRGQTIIIDVPKNGDVKLTRAIGDVYLKFAETNSQHAKPESDMSLTIVSSRALWLVITNTTNQSVALRVNSSKYVISAYQQTNITVEENTKVEIETAGLIFKNYGKYIIPQNDMTLEVVKG